MRSWLKPWFGQALRLGIAPDGLALVRTSRWQHERALLLGELRLSTNGQYQGLDAVAAALPLLLDEHEHALAGMPLTVVLSDELVRLWQVAPPPGAARMADLEAAAALRYQALFGA